MSSLRPPGLGPIVGHTTDTTCRLWIRAGDPEDAGSKLAPDRRTVGVVTVLERDGQPLDDDAPIFYFRLHREFDRTGTFNLGADAGLGARPEDKPYELAPDTAYGVCMGTLTIDDPLDDDETLESHDLRAKLPDPTVWREDFAALVERHEDRAVARFRTFPADPGTAAENLSFLLGSCRYPGILWKVKRADRIFGPMCAQALNEDDAKRPRLVLMAGDQIYADMFSRALPIGLADTFEEFQERYVAAFGSRNMRKLLRHVPTYMILDDHEIEDNWSRDRLKKRRKRTLFNIAINAYMSYQWSHGPRTFGRRLHYEFVAAGFPFFVLDTRTQRIKGETDDITDNHMLGRPLPDPDEPGQLRRLLDWLERQQVERGDVPKFIVSSNVFAPNAMADRTGRANQGSLERSDSWPAFPETRTALLECLVAHGIQNVVFLSGDIHCSNVAEITFAGSDAAAKLRAFGVTSSAFYWPFPFADGEPSDFVHDSRAKGQEDTFAFGDGLSMDYEACNFTQLDNFCRLEVDRANHEILVQVFDDDGEPIERANGEPMTHRLELAEW